MDLTPLFRDRHEAGERLAVRVSEEVSASGSDITVLALPRGGVPVAWPIANRLGAQLDIFLVRKIGAPGQEELALGAIASGGVQVLNSWVVNSLGVSRSMIDVIAQREEIELRRREELYRGSMPPADPRGRVAIVVDDGLATGASMRASVRALRQREPRQIIVAVPVASKDACEMLGRESDQVICYATPDPFVSVGVWYERFDQITDDEVRRLLDDAWNASTPGHRYGNDAHSSSS